MSDLYMRKPGKFLITYLFVFFSLTSTSAREMSLNVLATKPDQGREEIPSEFRHENSENEPTVVTKPLEDYILRGLSEKQRKRLTDIDTESSKSLKNFSVKLDLKPRKVARQDYTVYLAKRHSKPTCWYFLCRPGVQRIVSVLKTMDRKEFILNPQEFFLYDGLPALEEITQKQAETIWGNGKDKTSFVSYKLTSINEGKKEPLFLDIIYKNDKLSEYRIQSDSIGTTEWKSVNKTQ